ncbi:MAG TPA: hypothetical protein VKD90_18590 [Gemmataceae bacterium]|nr:hypothetical protein [Gemmataceae bacterium]
MKDRYDPWYVRLPDGRTIKAKSTASVRHHIESGHIPLSSHVRRDANEEWVGLVWVAEFSDYRKEAAAQPVATPASAPARSGVHARLDPLRLQTVGVRGLIDELIAALDSALTRSKVLPAFAAAVLLYVGLYSVPLILSAARTSATAVLAAQAAVAVLILSVLNAVLVKLTHLELSTMRPARFGDAFRMRSAYLAHVLVANVVVAVPGLVLLWVLYQLPGWTADWLRDAETAREAVRIPLVVIVLFLSVLTWLVIGLCWLLAPAVVVEDSTWLAGVRVWRQLLGDHFGRIVVYEGLAVLLGVAISLPLTLATGLAVGGPPGLLPAWPVPAGEAGWAGAPAAVVQGLAAGPLLALLPVANVFIYLNLRYEQGK